MDTYELIYDEAIRIARIAHRGQYRNDGITSYIKHPFELADMFDDYLDKAIAILHDAVEDGKDKGITFEYVEEYLSAISDDTKAITYIVEGLRDLTHIKTESTYMQYVDKIRSEYIKFKVGDMTLNMTDSPTDYQKQKYRKAMRILLKKM